MKKRFVNLIATIVAIFCGLFAFSACSKVEFKVNFVVDGAVYATLNTNGEEIIKMPENPTKDDYNFDGWYWDKDTWQTPFTANSLLNAPLSSDMNVYCKWKPKTVDGGNEETKNGLSFKNLSVDGTIVYGKVSNATETFSFLEEITANGASKFVVALDIYGAQQVATKTIALSVGDNIAYIMETIDGETVKMYTVTVRRRPIYTVSFDADGGTAVQSQQVEEDSFAAEPTTRRTGYTFARWNYDFLQAITKRTEIKAVWSAHTDTKYKTEYYLQNLENDEYTLHETSDSQGTTDTTANAKIKNFAHFTHIATASNSGNIAPDGSLVLKVYYTRDKYNVIFEGNGGTLESGEVNQILKYEGAAVAPVFTRTGYKLIWDKDFSSVNGNITVTAQWKINQYSLTLVLGGIRENEIITQNYNSTLEISNPERAGYDFSCWDKSIPATMPAENITITAQWNAIFKLSENGDTITGLTDYGKNKYTEIVIPAEIDDVKIISIGEKAFYKCSGLTSVTIPDSVISIGDYAFYNCSGLTSITITDGVTSIGNWAFQKCSGLTNLTIGNSVTSIGNAAFENCSGLKNISIPNSVISIGSAAFEYCNGLTSITIPNSVTSLGSSAFFGCSKLTNVTIGNSVTSIGDYAFGECFKLTSIIIGNSVTSIGENAFLCCSRLTSITIPDSVTSIGGLAFDSCSGLKGVYITDLEKWCKISFDGSEANPLTYAHNLYLNNQLVTDLVIPNTITTINNSVFKGGSGLTSVKIPDSVTFIGVAAFSGCSGLESITIPNSVTSIGNNAFSGCSGLKSVTIPNSVTSLGSSAFSSCSGLTSITIADGLTSIGDYAFENCSGLTSITIPDSVTSIGEKAFYNCSGLTSVTIPDSVTSIGRWTFQKCNGLAKVYYSGNENEWNKLLAIGSGNYGLTKTMIYYYSETQPEVEGNFWHYNENGEIEEW